MPSSYRHVFNTLFYHNGIYFTLEECQLICSLRELSADDDTVSEIIKHERGSPEPVNCAGLDQNLLDTSFSTLAGQATFPIVWDVEAALVKARVAYRKWMEYMTGIIWEYQKRGRLHEVSHMAPSPVRWMELVPSRPPFTALSFGEKDEHRYSWSELGWDVQPAGNTGTACE